MIPAWSAVIMQRRRNSLNPIGRLRFAITITTISEITRLPITISQFDDPDMVREMGFVVPI
jgi:hypothetical protein